VLAKWNDCRLDQTQENLKLNKNMLIHLFGFWPDAIVAVFLQALNDKFWKFEIMFDPVVKDFKHFCSPQNLSLLTLALSSHPSFRLSGKMYDAILKASRAK